MLHNVGATNVGNTQSGDIEWLARWLFGSSNFGMGSVDTFQWSISNEEFEKLGLLPDRAWTGKRWETLEPAEAEAWKKLARLCLYVLPHIAERIGHRFMEQAKMLRIVQRANRGELSNNHTGPGGVTAGETAQSPNAGAKRSGG